jgi:hypothetical protein
VVELVGENVFVMEGDKDGEHVAEGVAEVEIVTVGLHDREGVEVKVVVLVNVRLHVQECDKVLDGVFDGVDVSEIVHDAVNVEEVEDDGENVGVFVSDDVRDTVQDRVGDAVDVPDGVVVIVFVKVGLAVVD